MTAKICSIVFRRWVAIALGVLLLSAGYSRALVQPAPGQCRRRDGACRARGMGRVHHQGGAGGLPAGNHRAPRHQGWPQGRHAAGDQPHGRQGLWPDHHDGHGAFLHRYGAEDAGLPERSPPGPGAAARAAASCRGDRLEIQTNTSGKTISSSLAWSGDEGGFFAVERSLLLRPMKAGEKRHRPVPHARRQSGGPDGPDASKSGE